MRRAGRLLFSAAVSLLMLSSAYCEDTSDLFLQAWQDVQTGEKMERDAQPQNALEKYRSAADILRKIGSSQPDWQPLVIDYRLKKTQADIARLESDLAKQASNPATPEGALPEASPTDNSQEMPEVSTQPVTGTNSPPGRRFSETTAETYPDISSSSVRDLRRQIAQLRRQNEQLSSNLQQRTAELDSAQVELDRTKVNVVEVQAQLTQATDALDNAHKDQSTVGSQERQYQTQMAQVLQKLEEATADNDVLTDENNRLMGKLDQASKYIQASDAIRTGLLKERGTLADARDTATARTKRIKDNAVAMDRMTDENHALKKQVTALQKTAVPKEDMDKLAAEKAALETKYATVQKQLKEAPQVADVEKLAAENKDLAQKLKEAQRNSVSKADMDKIVAEKAEIEAKYADAQKQLKDTTAAAPEKDKLVTTLQGELNSVNDKLLEAQAQLAQSQDQIRELQKDLDETSGQLAELKINGSAKEQQNLSAENELLRGIILRQIKEQSGRDAAKKTLEDEITALKIKSDVITQQLQVLGAPVLELTAQERALFKQPIALLSEPNAQSLDVSMTISKSAVQPGNKTAAASGTTSNDAQSLPPQVRDEVQQAQKFFNNNDYAEAEKIYQKIVDEVPDNYFALSNLGLVQIESGKLTAAEVALKRASELNPKDAFSFTNLGVAYSRQGKFDEAIAALQHSLSLNAADPVAHNYLGVCLGQKQDPIGSEKELKRAIELNKDYAEAHFNLAVLYATVQPPSLDLAKLHYKLATQLGAPPDPSLEHLIQ